MRILLDITLVAALLAVVSGVGGALLIRHVVRRLGRVARARIGAARTASAGYRPADRPVGPGNRSPFRGAAGLITARAQGPALSISAYLPGAAGAVYQVRRDLHRDVTTTSRVVRSARRAGRPVDGLETSVAALARQAQELQLDLRIIAAEPDRDVQARTLAAHTARAALIQRTCAQVRTAVLAQGSGSNESTLQRTVEDVDDAVTAADLRVRAYQELSRR